ncbi:MAG: hypothetical protein RL398_2887, partial [Planctomycetota bacterium]
MHRPLRYLVMCLIVCTGCQQEPVNDAVVSVVDHAGRPVPRASV